MYTNISEKQESTWIVGVKELANRLGASFPKPKPCFPHLAYYSTLNMRAASSSKHWCIFTISHSTTSQKTIILICLYAQVHTTLLFKFWCHTWSTVKLSLGLITCHMGSGGIFPLILTSAVLRRYMISFMPEPLHSTGKQSPLQLKRRLHGPHSQWTFGGDKNVLSLPGVELRFLSCPAHSLFSMLTNICMFIPDILC
jgi:hypothetical protein